MQPDHEVAVIGAGFSGIGTAIKLDQAGIEDWVVLEAGDGVGGTWHWVSAVGFDDERHLWRLGIAGGENISARFLVGATGVFTQPKPPQIPGLETFAGSVMHNARWDLDDYRFTASGARWPSASAAAIR